MMEQQRQMIEELRNEQNQKQDEPEQNLLNDDDKHKPNALHNAAFNGQNRTIDFLLKKGLDLNCADYDGNNALLYSAFNGHNGKISTK